MKKAETQAKLMVYLAVTKRGGCSAVFEDQDDAQKALGKGDVEFIETWAVTPYSKVFPLEGEAPLSLLGGCPASTATVCQVEHARWAVELADRGEFHGRPRDLAEYRAIVVAANASLTRGGGVLPPTWEFVDVLRGALLNIANESTERSIAAMADKALAEVPTLPLRGVVPGDHVRFRFGGDDHKGILLELFDNGDHGQWCRVWTPTRKTGPRLQDEEGGEYSFPVKDCTRIPGPREERTRG